MKPRSMTPMGSLHPVLFFAGVYVVALLFSIFICSSLFYSCNASAAKPVGKGEKPSIESVKQPADQMAFK